MSEAIRQGYMRTVWAASLLAALAWVSASECRAAASAAELPATARVDFAVTDGPLARTYRFNNVVGASAFAGVRARDVRFLNREGLHGKIYRVWINDSIYDPTRGACECRKVAAYLSEISSVSDSLLVNFMPLRAIESGETPAQMLPMLETVIGQLKRRFPKIDYIEAFNEPDYNFRKTMKPTDLYRYYVPFYEAVNEVNSKLHPNVPMRVGGPALYEFDVPWLKAFLAGYAADSSPRKRLDFISYHAYGYFDSGTSGAFHFYRSNPSALARFRGRLDALLRQAGLDTAIPSFITEMGLYPGPSFDDLEGHADALRQAAGMASYAYWFMSSSRNVAFNWVVRIPSNWRKDELVTRPLTGHEVPTDELTPYGNMMLMMSRMKTTRVSASSDRLEHGKGVYVLASKDGSGASIMLWNYQDKGRTGFRVALRLSHPPAALRMEPVRERLFRIGATTSNYYGDPKHPNLQQVGSRTIRMRDGYRQTVDLAPNALELILLAPESRVHVSLDPCEMAHCSHEVSQ